MRYSITLSIYRTNPKPVFRMVEKTVWKNAHDGVWTEHDGGHVLTMGGNGTSGTLRFEADTGEKFIVAVGVHNQKRWADIVPNLSSEQTGVVINSEYYDGTRDYQRERQLSAYDTVNAQGRRIELKYTMFDGNNLKADLIIG